MNETRDEITQLYLDDIIPNRFQPREVFDEKALKELSSSIKEHGVIQPIIVRNIGGKYEIIAGERRYKASAMAGLTKIPAIIRNLDDKESSKVALLENLQRKDLNPVEEARTYQKILELDEMTQEELAKTMGKSQSSVANKIRLLSLPDEVQNALLKEQISERHARAILNIPTMAEQIETLKRVISNKISVRVLEEEIKEKYKKEDVNMEENVVVANAKDFLSNAPLTPQENLLSPTGAPVGTVTIAPPTDDSFDNTIKASPIDFSNDEDDDTDEEEFNSDLPSINNIKGLSEDIEVTTGTNLDSLLNISTNKENYTTPAEAIIKNDLPQIEEPTENYFSNPDLSTIEVPKVEQEEKIYNIDTAKKMINNLVAELKENGINIKSDEMDLPKSFQVIIKLEK